MFPALLEVDRYLYFKRGETIMVKVFKFPASLEVDRFLYPIADDTKPDTNKFPAPREVNWVFYNNMKS